jgi:hypothetical protein
MREVIMNLMLEVCSECESSKIWRTQTRLESASFGRAAEQRLALSMCIILSNRLSHNHDVHKEVASILVVITDFGVHWKYRTFAV